MLLLFVVASWIYPMVDSWLYRSNYRQLGFGRLQFQTNSRARKPRVFVEILAAITAAEPDISVGNPLYKIDTSLAATVLPAGGDPVGPNEFWRMDLEDPMPTMDSEIQIPSKSLFIFIAVR